MAKSQLLESSSFSSLSGRTFEQLSIQKINSPGCYVDSRTGDLYRVTPEMLTIGGTVFYGFVSREPWNVTRISDDYTLPLDEARIIAANASLNINF